MPTGLMFQENDLIYLDMSGNPKSLFESGEYTISTITSNSEYDYVHENWLFMESCESRLQKFWRWMN